MSRIKKVLIALISFVVFFTECIEKKTAPPSPTPHPFSIEALRTRVFEQSGLTLGQQVASTKMYTSRIVSYESDGYKLNALMYVPVRNSGKTKLPVVIVNHGYIQPDVYSTIKSYNDVSSNFATNGFLVFKPDYRGHDDSEGLAEGVFRTVNYSIDVINLIEAIRTFPQADTDNMFMFGHSMGGEVTLRVLEVTDTIKAATLWAPVSAPFPENTLYFVRKGSAETAANLEADINKEIDSSYYDSLSPLYYTKYIGIPLLLHHGTKDESVPYEWSLRLKEKFDENGVKYTFFTYEGENHNLSVRNYATVKKKDVDFFKQFMH